MDESKLLLALFCNKILTKSERGVVVVVSSVPFGCVTLTVTLQHYSGGECEEEGYVGRPLHRHLPAAVVSCQTIPMRSCFPFCS